MVKWTRIENDRHRQSSSCLPCSVHGISQARILEWVAISTSRGSSWLRNWTHISCGSWVGRWILYPKWTFPFQNTEIWNSSGSFLFLSPPPLECLQDLKLLGISPHFVYCIRDAIQPSHPLMTTSLSALNLSQHQGLFQWAGCWHQMTKNTGVSAAASVLPMISLKRSF